MEYRSLVKNYIKKINEDFSEGTLKMYGLKLNQLNRDINNNLPFDDKFTFLNDHQKVHEYIKDFNIDNLLAFLNSIVAIIQDKKLKDIYIKMREPYYKLKDAKIAENVKPANFTEYKDLLEKTEIPSFDGMSIKEAVNKFMIYMAVRYPIRLELHDLPIMRVKKNMDPNKNYFYITNKKMEIIMNSFKNVKSFGKTEILIDKEDEKVIKEYLKYLTDHGIKQVNLIENVIKDTVLPIPRKTFTQKLTSELNKLFKKRNLTMNDIRSSYETNLINSDEYKKMKNTDKIKLHHRLLHSMSRAHSGYNKV